ncbi:plastocyanin/azurin family copper-binding protein [Halobacterium zhouii]|uniref:plastocyanin/azurin family copper-binding protein n=1 Tax=Halobacterium zhouii TaxID=2902624 RepID=UPI001E58363D|nr:plastocyanin/azurin family copper-binding protein [Halobacterium zhouii]
MHRRTFLATGSATALAAVAGCIGPSFAESEYDIGMQSNAFLPDDPVAGADRPTFEAAVGDTVIWANTGSRNHTVTAYGSGIPDDAAYFASGGFDSEQAARDAWSEHIADAGNVSPGETYEHTFEVPGDYHYFCIPHESAGMIGKVVVTE